MTTSHIVATITRDATNNKFNCTINGASLGSSKHEDYFEYHYKRGDIARLNKLAIDQFAYMNDDGTVKEIKDAKKAVPKNKAAEPAPTAVVATDATDTTAQTAAPAADAEQTSTTTVAPTVQ